MLKRFFFISFLNGATTTQQFLKTKHLVPGDLCEDISDCGILKKMIGSMGSLSMAAAEGSVFLTSLQATLLVVSIQFISLCVLC
jgi:hypothetical protein